MKILIVTQNFYPENFKSNDIAFEFAKKGHDITVLTGLPNYPEGKIYAEYGFFKKRSEYINGVRIVRALLVPRGVGGGVRLFINYFSWTFFASIKAFFLSFNNKFDAVLVHQTSPIIQGFPAIIVKRIQKIPLFFWVLDLWPESLQSAGGINNKVVLNMFGVISKYIYSQSDKILISSKGFQKSILEKGNFIDKMVYFPNWSEDEITNGASDYPIPDLPNGFKVLFAGNIGESQDMPSILEAAKLLKHKKDIHFIILGYGRKKSWMIDYIRENDLSDTVHLLGRFPLESMNAFFMKADALLVTLKDELIFNLTVPAKMQAYMSVGKPILSMLSGEGSQIIEQSRGGLSANAGDFKKLSDNIIELYNLPNSEMKKIGENAKIYYKENFEKQSCINNLEIIIEELKL